MALKVQFNALNLDDHAKDKFLRLVKDRYNAKNCEMTFVLDRC